MLIALARSKVFVGDVLLLTLLASFIALMLVRVQRGKDTPPPGFILVGLSFLSAATGTGLAVMQHFHEMESTWVMLQRLLSYQGFVLLPILGIGPFILPRLFGMQSQHDFPEMRIPVAAWWKKAALAFSAGALVIGSFFIEARGWCRTAHALRFATALAYVWMEMPFHRAPATNSLGVGVRIAFAGILAGFLAVAIFPGYRVGLLHLTLVGGFATIAFVVATRVVLGHSGNVTLRQSRRRWLLVAIGLMLFGMATRISGDFWPAILASHYTYGALIWIAGVLLWSTYVLPRVFEIDTEN